MARYENTVTFTIEADDLDKAKAGLDALLKSALDVGSRIEVRDQFGQVIDPPVANFSGWHFFPGQIKEVEA